MIHAGTARCRHELPVVGRTDYRLTRRILHVIASLDRAGAEKQLVLLARGLVQHDFDVHVCALTRGGPRAADLRQAAIPVRVLGKRWKADPFALWRLRRHIRQLAPDLVHTWMFTANTYGRLAAMMARVGLLVAAERCADPWKSWLQISLDRVLARRTQRIVANSRGVVDFYTRQGLPPGRFAVIAGGVPAAVDPTTSRAELLRELGLPASVRLIGAVGRLWPQKRVKDLIWAADLVHLINPDVRLLIIGDGPQRRSLERFTRLLEAEDHVRFLGERDDVWRIMPHLDVLWQGSQYEGLPNAILEAMAAAVPVVATDISGHRELVIPGQTGYLVGVGARAQRTHLTDKILRDPALASRLGSAGRQHVLQHFGVDSMVRQYVDLYEQLLSG